MSRHGIGITLASVVFGIGVVLIIVDEYRPHPSVGSFLPDSTTIALRIDSVPTSVPDALVPVVDSVRNVYRSLVQTLGQAPDRVVYFTWHDGTHDQVGLVIDGAPRLSRTLRARLSDPILFEAWRGLLKRYAIATDEPLHVSIGGSNSVVTISSALLPASQSWKFTRLFDAQYDVAFSGDQDQLRSIIQSSFPPAFVDDIIPEMTGEVIVGFRVGSPHVIDVSYTVSTTTVPSMSVMNEPRLVDATMVVAGTLLQADQGTALTVAVSPLVHALATRYLAPERTLVQRVSRLSSISFNGMNWLGSGSEDVVRGVAGYLAGYHVPEAVVRTLPDGTMYRELVRATSTPEIIQEQGASLMAWSLGEGHLFAATSTERTVLGESAPTVQGEQLTIGSGITWCLGRSPGTVVGVIEAAGISPEVRQFGIYQLRFDDGTSKVRACWE